MRLSFGLLFIFIAIIAKFGLVNGDCEMDCTDSDVRQSYREKDSRVNDGTYFRLQCIILL